jgi:hypothetical protein
MAILITLPSLYNVTTLRTSIGNWLHRADYLNFVDDLITVAEKWIFRNARIIQMEKAMSISVINGVAALPFDYIALKYAYIDASPIYKLDRKGADWIFQNYPDRSTTGTPRTIATDVENFVFGPPVSDGSVLKGTYWARPESVFTSTNDIISNHPDLYLFAALAEAAPYIRDDARVEMWTAKRNAILADINGETQRERFSGNVLQIRAG